MKRKRNGFVPLGNVAEAVKLPDDRALTRAAAPPRHFTRLDQMVQLVERERSRSGARLHRAAARAVQLTAHQPRQSDLQYVRRNGPYTLVMSSREHRRSCPTVNLPRLLFAWVTTEAVRTQSPVLVLEDSLSAFMRKLGRRKHQRQNAGRIRLRNQMDRLYSTQSVIADVRGRTRASGSSSSTIAESGESSGGT